MVKNNDMDSERIAATLDNFEKKVSCLMDDYKKLNKINKH